MNDVDRVQVAQREGRGMNWPIEWSDGGSAWKLYHDGKGTCYDRWSSGGSIRPDPLVWKWDANQRLVVFKWKVHLHSDEWRQAPDELTKQYMQAIQLEIEEC